MFLNSFSRFENVECGLVHVIAPDSNNLYSGEEVSSIVAIPCKSVDVNASVAHAVSKVQVTQIFVNKESRALEAIYYFPFDSNGGVTNFYAELEGRIIKGVVISQEKARAQYEKAIGQKQSAFPVAANRPDIFKARVGILKSGQEIKIVIHYVSELKNPRGLNGGIGFSIPSTVVPTFVQNDVQEPPSSPVTITVDVGILGNIKDIDSPSHPIQVDTRGRKTTVSFSANVAYMDRAFELSIIPEDTSTPRLYVEVQRNPNGETTTAMMAHLIPRIRAPKQNVELIFLLDRSGSMKEFSIALAQRALQLFLHSLPLNCYFNVVGFGYEYEFLFPESRKYDEESLKAALIYSQGLVANMGGTEILPPLQAIFNMDKIRGYNRQIFVLTDGAVTNTDQVIDLCRSGGQNQGHGRSYGFDYTGGQSQGQGQGPRVFTLGIGRDASRALVEGMAQVSGGTATFVIDNENFESQVLEHLANAVEHALTNVRFKWVGLPDEQLQQSEVSQGQGASPPGSPTPPPGSPTPTIESKMKSLVGSILEPISRLSPTFQKYIPAIGFTPSSNTISSMQIPQNVGPVFDGRQLVVFGLFPGQNVPTGVEIEADSPDGPFSVQMDAEMSGSGSGTILELGIIKALRQMEVQLAIAMENESQNEKRIGQLKRDIVNMSCEYGIPSKHTAYVVQDSASNENWNLSYVDKPNWEFLPANQTYSYVRDGVAKMKKQSPYDYYEGGQRDENRNREVSLVVSGTGGRRSTSPIPKFPSGGSSFRETRMTAEDRFHAIVATQSFNGSFPLNQEFCDAIGQSLGRLLDESGRGDWSTQALATALALAFFAEKLGGFRNSWELVAEKAHNWLHVNFPDETSEIMQGARRIVQNYGTTI